MKPIILIDEIPSKCHGCRFDDFDYRCKLTGFDHEDYVMRGTRDIRCPLKSMPNDYPPYTKIREQNFYTEEESDAYEKGWNDCLEEIQK